VYAEEDWDADKAKGDTDEEESESAGDVTTVDGCDGATIVCDEASCLELSAAMEALKTGIL